MLALSSPQAIKITLRAFIIVEIPIVMIPAGDCMLLGIGNSSNIMFNVGGTTISSRTRMVLLEGASRKEAARTFPSQEVRAIDIRRIDIDLIE